MSKVSSVSLEQIGNFDLRLSDLSSININQFLVKFITKIDGLVDAKDLGLTSFTQVIALEVLLEFLMETDNKTNSLVLFDLGIDNSQL